VSALHSQQAEISLLSWLIGNEAIKKCLSHNYFCRWLTEKTPPRVQMPIHLNRSGHTHTALNPTLKYVTYLMGISHR